jgi:hypothetical protein
MLDSIEFPERVRAEIAAGRLWRAKEILAGRVTTAFSFDACEQYGVVLMATHDLMAAGRYLFASGKRRAEYEEAIALFLARNGSSGDDLLGALPARVKTLPFEQLPQNVQEEIRARGPRKAREARTPKAHEAGCRDLLALTGCVVAAFLLIWIFIEGVSAVFRALRPFFM